MLIVNGAGATASVNGMGNLVIGYDENPSKRAQTGSHDVVLGRNHSFTGYAQLLDGFQNTAAGNSGGCSNIAGTGSVSLNSACTNTTGSPNGFAAVGGGAGNQALKTASAVTCGTQNGAQDPFSLITGGCVNLILATATSAPEFTLCDSASGGEMQSITGGYNNLETGTLATVTGGSVNTASGPQASVTGGSANTASGANPGSPAGYQSR